MNSQPAVPSKHPCPPLTSKNVGAQHYLTASIPVKSPIASDPVAPSRGFSSVLIKPQAAKIITQIQAAAKCTTTHLKSDPKPSPSFQFVDLEKELVAKIEKNKKRKYLKSKSPDGADVFIRIKTDEDP